MRVISTKLKLRKVESKTKNPVLFLPRRSQFRRSQCYEKLREEPNLFEPFSEKARHVEIAKTTCWVGQDNVLSLADPHKWQKNKIYVCTLKTVFWTRWSVFFRFRMTQKTWMTQYLGEGTEGKSHLICFVSQKSEGFPWIQKFLLISFVRTSKLATFVA